MSTVDLYECGTLQYTFGSRTENSPNRDRGHMYGDMCVNSADSTEFPNEDLSHGKYVSYLLSFIPEGKGRGGKY